MSRQTCAIILFAAVFACASLTSEYEISEKDKNKNSDVDLEDAALAFSNTLKLVHVLFRHGDRTPLNRTYPNDPYANETYEPFGKNQLTIRGRARAYRLGEILRERYNSFLGPLYVPDLIEVRSSATASTMATLEFVLAGLFSNTEGYKIQENLLTQHIPFDFDPQALDILLDSNILCENIFTEVERLQMTPEARNDFRKHIRFYDYLSEMSGADVNSTTNAWSIYTVLVTEKEWGLKLPAWTDKVWKEPLKRAASAFWRFYGSTAKLRQMTIGNLMEKIINDTIMHFTDDVPPERKMFLYSGHDYNIVPFMAALGNTIVEVPYAAYVLLEVHVVDDKYFIKAFYNDYSEAEPKLLRVKDCPELCPFEQFEDLMSENIPLSNDWCSLE